MGKTRVGKTRPKSRRPRTFPASRRRRSCARCPLAPRTTTRRSLPAALPARRRSRSSPTPAARARRWRRDPRPSSPPACGFRFVDNATVTFYGVSIDGGNDRSPCSPDPAVYVEDSTTPLTRITMGPGVKTRKRTAVFRFLDSAGETPGTTFLCKLDRRKWRACAAPFRAKRLSRRAHTLPGEGGRPGRQPGAEAGEAPLQGDPLSHAARRPPRARIQLRIDARRRPDRVRGGARRRQLRHRGCPPGAARHVDRRSPALSAPPAAPRSAPATTSRCSPGCCCGGGPAAAAPTSRLAIR